MNTNAKQWTEALRSGAYRQTTQRFREPGRRLWRRRAYCAIGVLYDLYLKARAEEWPTKPSPGQLPEPVLEWAGISRELEYEIVTRNDTGTSFRDIASIVEAHFHRANRDRRWAEAARIASRAIDSARVGARSSCVDVD